MLKIIVSGCNGHMGRVVAGLCAADPQVEVVAGFDVLGPADREFPVCSAPDQFQGEADAVIDFSSPAALDGLLKFARERKVPLVLATTGYTPEQAAQIGAAALEVEGVTGLAGGTMSEQLLGRKKLSKGITILWESDNITINVSIQIRYGGTIPEVARKVQEAIVTSVEDTSGLKVAAVNVRVGGVTFEKPEA